MTATETFISRYGRNIHSFIHWLLKLSWIVRLNVKCHVCKRWIFTHESRSWKHSFGDMLDLYATVDFERKLGKQKFYLSQSWTARNGGIAIKLDRILAIC